MRKYALLIALLLICSCSKDETYTAYSKYKASFTYDKVMTMTPLKNALTSPGEFCTISLGVSTLNFASLTMSQSDPITDNTLYYQKYKCINGFIVGMANIPEMNADGLSAVCFDLVCSNCYHVDNVTRSVALQENGMAYCSRCKRKYGLNNQGLVVGGDAGRPLERYHIAYDGSNRMVISN